MNATLRDHTRVVGYLRVSSEEQTRSGAGLEAQKAVIAAEALRRSWIVEWFTDEGYSARDLSRPAIQSALDALCRRTHKALVVAKVDRLSRSSHDFSGLLEKSIREGWAVVALDLGVDTSTPAGEAMANVVATFAQYERRLISVRTKEALAQVRARGVILGRPPAVPENIVDRIKHERKQGRTLRDIARHLDIDGVPTPQGGKQWWASTISGVLKKAGQEGPPTPVVINRPVSTEAGSPVSGPPLTRQPFPQGTVT